MTPWESLGPMILCGCQTGGLSSSCADRCVQCCARRTGLRAARRLEAHQGMDERGEQFARHVGGVVGSRSANMVGESMSWAAATRVSSLFAGATHDSPAKIHAMSRNGTPHSSGHDMDLVRLTHHSRGCKLATNALGRADFKYPYGRPRLDRSCSVRRTAAVALPCVRRSDRRGTPGNWDCAVLLGASDGRGWLL